MPLVLIENDQEWNRRHSAEGPPVVLDERGDGDVTYLYPDGATLAKHVGTGQPPTRREPDGDALAIIRYWTTTANRTKRKFDEAKHAALAGDAAALAALPDLKRRHDAAAKKAAELRAPLDAAEAERRRRLRRAERQLREQAEAEAARIRREAEAIVLDEPPPAGDDDDAASADGHPSGTVADGENIAALKRELETQNRLLRERLSANHNP